MCRDIFGSGWLRASILLAAATLSLPVRAGAAEDAGSPKIVEAVRDGTGRVWGISRDRSSDLYVLDGDEPWRPANPPKLGDKAQPCALGQRADGTVVCVWRLDENHYRWSTHRGPDSQLGPPFDLKERRYGQDLRLTGDSKNNLWLTQEGPDIYRLAPEGTVECAHTLSAEECLAGTYANEDRASVWNAVSVFEDAGGRVWLWTDHADGGSNGATIRGALVYEGGKFVQHDFLLPGGGSPGSLTALAQKDPQHLWFARMFDGLYTLDTTTFQAERVADQPREASLTSLVAYARCGVAYFIMGQTRTGGGCTLWRFKGNQWTKVLDPVDAQYKFRHQQDRVWSVAEHGEYLGTNGNGLWFLPCDGSEPVHVDWRRRFPLATPHRFIDLQNGRWLGISTTGVTWVGAPAALTAERDVPDNPRLRTLRVEQRLYGDVRGHLWSAFTFNSPVLHEWDGERWSEHRFPAELGARSFLRMLNTDLSGRVWLRSSSQQRRVVTYDPPTDHWQVFDGLEQALAAQAGRADAEFRTAVEQFDLPRFGPQGRICYLTSEWKVMAFTGGAWRAWTRGEITGQPGHFAFDGAPFIDHEGRISVNADRQTWELREGTGWQTTAYEQGFADNNVLAARLPAEVKLPFQPASAARDNQGSWWLTWQRGLYRFRDGLCVPVLKAGEPQPFSDARRLAEAFIDARGNAFLRSGDGRDEYVILAPPGLLPQTTLAEAAPGRGDRRVIRLTTGAGPVDGKVRFSWRLDGGGWNALAADGPSATVALETLPGGPHRFEARSFDAELQTDTVPAALDFRVDLDPQAQVDGYLVELAVPDDDRRKAAVRALARQPDRARAALQAARARTTDADERWWIDAALQQIETDRGTSAR